VLTRNWALFGLLRANLVLEDACYGGEPQAVSLYQILLDFDVVCLNAPMYGIRPDGQARQAGTLFRLVIRLVLVVATFFPKIAGFVPNI
jgi:hypothetical protein